MKFIIGIPSFNRPKILKLTLSRLALHRKRIAGVIVVADAESKQYFDQYKEVLEKYEGKLNIVYELHYGRRGSAKARNRVLDLAEQNFPDGCTLVTYDDDYLCPRGDWLAPTLRWLRREDVGVVGGRVVNLRRRRVDPDFALNALPGLADALTRATGFVFLDTKHGPRYVDYTTHLMAVKMSVVREGVRYDSEYKGTGYREESDFQEQVRKLGYKIVFEPGFYAYHLNLEEGGDRAIGEASGRFYWKARNNVYFVRKHGLGVRKLVISTAIIVAYSALHGWGVLRATARAVREALTDAKLGRGTLSPLK